MKQEDFILLLKVLCELLPYEVKGKCKIDTSYDTEFDVRTQYHCFDAELVGIKEEGIYVHPLIDCMAEQEYANEEVADGIDIDEFTPYLRSMSSMTNEERIVYEQCLHDVGRSVDVIDADDVVKYIDWLKKKKFDYWGLIPKGLAYEAPEGMY
jgi:hypothetical protein